MQTKAKISTIVVTGKNSGVAVEMDLEIINKVFEWFVSESPKEIRTLHNVGRVIRCNDQIVDILSAETKSSVDYIEKESTRRLGLPVDGDKRYEEQDASLRQFHFRDV